MPSTETVQQVINFASTHTELMPLTGVGGYTNEPGRSLANDTLNEILGQEIPWKFNRKEMNALALQRGKQDYLFAGASLFVLTDGFGVGIDLATNNALTISGATVTIKTLEQYGGAVGDVCYITGTGSNYDSTLSKTPNSTSWGGCTYTITNISGLTLTATVSGGTPSGVSGAPGITDFQWLESGTLVDASNTNSPQIVRFVKAVRELQPTSVVYIPQKVAVMQDQPSAGVLKVRVSPVPGATPYLLSNVYQAKPPVISSGATLSSTTWTPIPDEYQNIVRQMFLAMAYRYLGSPKEVVEYQKAQQLMTRSTGRDDREQSDEFITPELPIDTSGLTPGWWL